MKIGELAEKLGIARENIRYYESQNLLHVQRSSNGYRDYSEKDEKELERIIALRKLNVSVKDILSYQKGDLSLKEVLEKAKEESEANAKSFSAASNVLSDLLKRDALNMDDVVNILQEKKSELPAVKENIVSYGINAVEESFGSYLSLLVSPFLSSVLPKRKKSRALAVYGIVLFILLGGLTWMKITETINGSWPHPFLQGMVIQIVILLFWIFLQYIFRNAKAGRMLSTLLSIILLTVIYLFGGRVLYFENYEKKAVLNGIPLSVDIRVITEDETKYSANDAEYLKKLLAKMYSLEAVRPARLKNYSDAELSGLQDVTVICFYGEDANPHTTFFLYESEGENILEEPHYGMFEVDDELISIIKEYENIKTMKDSLKEEALSEMKRIENFQNGNTNESCKQVLDRETGEDVTQSFYDQYKPLLEEGNCEAVLNALEEYRTVVYD